MELPLLLDSSRAAVRPETPALETVSDWILRWPTVCLPEHNNVVGHCEMSLSRYKLSSQNAPTVFQAKSVSWRGIGIYISKYLGEGIVGCRLLYL